jgi:hypothetical protein
MDYLKDNSVPDSQIPIEAKVLINTMHYWTGFTEYNIGGPEIQRFIHDNNITGLFLEAIGHLNHSRLDKVKEVIHKIRDLLYKARTELQQQPQPLQEHGEGQVQDNAEGQESNTCINSPDTGKLDLKEITRRGKESMDIFMKTDPNAKGHVISSASLSDQTRQRFSELLNVKEIRRIDDGRVVDTDNLTAFLTGEVEILFKDDIVKHTKKSKIIMVLDCSASMKEPMLDGKPRREVLAKAAKSITNLLDEVHAIEGINVDYDIRAFGSSYYKLPKENWGREYLKYHDSSTCLAHGFHEAQAELLVDYTVDGNKMVILMTDGEVNVDQIRKIQNDILMHNQDVRCMVVGVGADPCRKFMEEVCEHNILCEDMADTTILDCINEMVK